MEPSKANTVGIVKMSPSQCTTRKTLQFFQACSGFFFPQNGKDNKPNHPLLPYVRIKPKTQSQQGKKMIPYLRFEILSDTYLPSPYMYTELSPNPHSEDFTCHVASKHGLGRRMPGYS